MKSVIPALTRFTDIPSPFSLIRCRIDAGDALDDNHTLKEIQRFIRNGSGQVYVPGSSVKGALRTVLLTEMLVASYCYYPPGGMVRFCSAGMGIQPMSLSLAVLARALCGGHFYIMMPDAYA